MGYKEVTELQAKNKIKGFLYGYTDGKNLTQVNECQVHIDLLLTVLKYYENQMEQYLSTEDPF